MDERGSENASLGDNLSEGSDTANDNKKYVATYVFINALMTRQVQTQRVAARTTSHTIGQRHIR